MSTEENFEIELSDFLFVKRGIKNGMALRFTVTWKFEHPRYGLIGESEEGWLCTRAADGRLKVSPPISRFGPQQSKQMKTITVPYHDLILGMIVNNKTKSGSSYADKIGQAIPEELRPQTPAEVDPELPEEMRA